MVEEIIWTERATQDYLSASLTLVPDQDIDNFLGLAKVFPEIGSSVRWSSNIRRGLIGPKRVYGIFYSVHGGRLFVLALLDLRMDSKSIEAIVDTRLP